MNIVFFVTLTTRLDLAGTRNGMRLTPELLLGCATGHVETMRQLALQPIVKRGLRFDEQFAHQRIALQTGQIVTRRAAHPEIDQPAFEVGFIDPFCHLGIALVRHQKRQAEIAQQSFCRAFPVMLVLTHLQELARKWHLFFGQIERPAQGRAHGDLVTGNIAAPRFQTAEFGAQTFMLLFTLTHTHAMFGEMVLQGGFLGARGFGKF